MSNKLMIGIVAGIVTAVGAVLWFEGDAAAVYWVGQLFLRSLQMLIIPLVMLAVIVGVADLGDVRKLGRLGGWTAGYYLTTMLAAATIGLVVVNLLEPGVGIDTAGLGLEDEVERQELAVSDIVLQFVSDNIFAAMAELDILPVIVFSLLFGGVLSTTGEKGEPLLRVLRAGNEVMMRMVRLVMWLAPVGIFGLVAGRFGQAIGEGGTQAFVDQLLGLGRYVGAVVGGLGVHALVVLPLLLFLLARRNPLSYARGVASALLTAFSTASSSATLPVTLETTIEDNDVDERAARFVLPLGSTLNMDGSALYESMAAIFIAQTAGVDLSFGQQVVVVVVATLSAVGAAGIPEAGLVTMVMVLSAVNLPLAGLELLLPIDWFLDRFRTSVNVWGDAVGAGVIERMAFDERAASEPERS